MKRQPRLLSLLLVLCMVLPTLVGFTSLEEATETQTQKETTQSSTLKPSETFELPDIISREEAVSQGYVGRLKSKEDNLYSFVFDNGDGTNTMKLYSHPVKYVDASGETKDISLSVKANSDGSFKSASHSVTTTFKKKLSDGISLSHEDIDLVMVPKDIGNEAPIAKVSSDSKAVSYVLDSKTAYVYELTYLGFKEDIVVSEYTGQTEYKFTLYTNGLTLVKEDGSYYLADSNGNIKATIGDIIVFTADERNNTFGSMTHETVRANAEYTMTIHLDADYLRDEKTLYPIRIDPTIEIVSGGATGAIQDATMNSTAGSGGTSGSILVGVRNSYGISRAIMRFPTLSLDGVEASDIVSATIGLRDLMCQSSENITVECRIYDKSAPAWTESSPPTFTAAAPYVGATVLDSYVVTLNGGTGGGNWYHFNILEAARAWANGTQDPSKGLVFKAADSFENQTANKWYKTFSSYNRSSYKPSLKITYNTGVTIVPATVSIVEGGTYTLQATTNAPSVTWTSDNPSVATVDANGVVTAIKAGVANITATVGNTAASDTCTVYVHIPNGVYYIRNKNSDKIMQVYNGNFQDDTHIVQADKHAETLDISVIEMIRQQWGISYLGLGRHIIRPLHNTEDLLGYFNSEVYTTYYGETDEYLQTYYNVQWIIEWTSNGYVIKNGSVGNESLQIEGGSTSVGANVIMETDSSTLNCRWAIEKIILPSTSGDYSEQHSGVLVYDTYKNVLGTYSGQPLDAFKVYVAPNEVRSVDDMYLHLVTFPNVDQAFRWYSSDSSVAKINNDTGKLTGVSPGTAFITALTDSAHLVTFTVVVTEVANGTYFLKNKQTGYYADIKNHALTDGTQIVQWQFLGGGTQKWTFTHDGYGYYNIYIESGMNFFCMGVKNNSNVLDEDIVLHHESLFLSDQAPAWKISVTESGGLRLTPKHSESFDYALATSTSSQTNGARLVQGQYMYNNSYCDEWCLEPPRLYDVALLALSHEDNLDRSSYFGNIVAKLNTIGYTSYFNNHSVISHGWTKSYLLDFMQHSKITLIRTHGHKFAIEAADEPIEHTEISGLDYSELIVYGCCLTGEGGKFADNLVTATVDAGARTVIGFQNNVEVSACNEWCETFFEYFTQYYNDSTKDYNDVCAMTDGDLKKHKNYEIYIEDKEGKKVLASLRNYVVAGEDSLPGN